MKYYRLHIDCKPEYYDKVSEILKVKPTEFEKSKFENESIKIWTYTYDENEEADTKYYDFINEFLDILEPNFQELEKIEIGKEDITFWLNYEYDQQCGMEFHPQEMQRLGKNGIVLCIDCWQK